MRMILIFTERDSLKRSFAAITAEIVFCMSVLCFTGCQENTTDNKDDSTYSIVCTFFAQYDWINNIISEAENVSVSLICDNGTDLHSYQMTARDMLDISSCDLLIVIGGESDKWAQDAGKASGVKVVSLTELAQVDINEHLHEQDNTEDIHGDEHLWLSVKKAKELTDKLSEIICSEVQNDSIKNQAEEYIKKLDELDMEYEKACSRENGVLVVADRFPFAHLAKDYNIECFAAFDGCSADTDAGFETVIELAGIVDENNLKYVIVTENSDKKTARAVIDSTREKNAEILVLDSMQSLTENDIKGGAGYIGIMEENLRVISTAFES